MVFQNVFEGMSTEHIVAMCSCLVFDENVPGEAPTPEDPDLLRSFEKTKDIAHTIAQVMLESKVPVEVENYVSMLKPHMMSVVTQWLQQRPFKDIMAVSCNPGTYSAYVKSFSIHSVSLEMLIFLTLSQILFQFFEC
jgi:superfamily II RNA helicase